MNTEDLPEKLETPNFQSQTINGLVILFYKNLLLSSHKQYTNAYILCKALASRYGETMKIKKLNRLYSHTTCGYPMGLLQTIVYREMSLGVSTNRIFNYGYRVKPIKLGDMIVALDNSLELIVDMFTEICVTHDIDTSFTMPIMEGMQQQGVNL